MRPPGDRSGNGRGVGLVDRPRHRPHRQHDLAIAGAGTRSAAGRLSRGSARCHAQRPDRTYATRAPAQREADARPRCCRSRTRGSGGRVHAVHEHVVAVGEPRRAAGTGPRGWRRSRRRSRPRSPRGCRAARVCSRPQRLGRPGAARACRQRAARRRCSGRRGRSRSCGRATSGDGAAGPAQLVALEAQQVPVAVVGRDDVAQPADVAAPARAGRRRARRPGRRPSSRRSTPRAVAVDDQRSGADVAHGRAEPEPVLRPPGGRRGRRARSAPPGRGRAAARAPARAGVRRRRDERGGGARGDARRGARGSGGAGPRSHARYAPVPRGPRARRGCPGCRAARPVVARRARAAAARAVASAARSRCTGRTLLHIRPTRENEAMLKRVIVVSVVCRRAGGRRARRRGRPADGAGDRRRRSAAAPVAGADAADAARRRARAADRGRQRGRRRPRRQGRQGRPAPARGGVARRALLHHPRAGAPGGGRARCTARRAGVRVARSRAEGAREDRAGRRGAP